MSKGIPIGLLHFGPSTAKFCYLITEKAVQSMGCKVMETMFY